MENPEEILHSLEEFAKLKPKDIPRELEEYLCFVAKTGDPVYQWSVIKSLFREKLINVITEFYESCPSVDIPPCPNVDLFNYDLMKNFILEKLDTFVAAPFTVQRICELLTTPRKEYNRIDKYMRALEKNILVVSTTEPGNHRTPENGDGFINGIETEHIQDGTNDINIEEMDDSPSWPTKSATETVSFQSTSKNEMIIDNFTSENNSEPEPTNSNVESVITCCPSEEQPYVSIEPVNSDTIREETSTQETDVSVTITAIPAAVQKRRDSIEPPNEQINIEPPAETTVLESPNIVENKPSGDAPHCDKTEEEESKTEPVVIEDKKPVEEEEKPLSPKISEIEPDKEETIKLVETIPVEIEEEKPTIIIKPSDEATQEIPTVQEPEIALVPTEETPVIEETKLIEETKFIEETKIIIEAPEIAKCDEIEIETKAADEAPAEIATNLEIKNDEPPSEATTNDLSETVTTETPEIESTTEIPEEIKEIPMDVDVPELPEITETITDTAETTPTSLVLKEEN